MSDIEAEVSSLLGDLGLYEKKDSMAGTLSGGQKRALSVAIAFAGQPRVVILDEPTSGV